MTSPTGKLDSGEENVGAKATKEAADAIVVITDVIKAMDPDAEFPTVKAGDDFVDGAAGYLEPRTESKP